MRERSVPAAADIEMLQASLARLDHAPIPLGEKGFAFAAGRSAAQLVANRMSVSDLGTPIAVINSSRLASNIHYVQEWCNAAGAVLAPHVKTTMSPHIISQQLMAGAWGVTVATVTQAVAVIDVGVRRVLIANEVVDPVDFELMRRLQSTTGGLELICYVDSVKGVALLGAAFSNELSPLPVLVELGTEGGRAGARTTAVAREVAHEVIAATTLRLAGVAGFEGVLGGDRSPMTLHRVDDFLGDLSRLSAELRPLADATLDPNWIVSAGGSVFPDRVVKILGDHRSPHLVVVRSGGTVTSDDTYLGEFSPEFAGAPLAPAIEVRARVISIPEPGLAILGVGKRDIGSDIALPTPRAVISPGGRTSLSGHRITAVNDQHAYLRAVGDAGVLHPDLEIGTLVSLGIAHPCTTFDRWRRVALADDIDHLVGVITTLF
jgi:D-serine deaminase-like pyridoxal phosphate-dependent protein